MHSKTPRTVGVLALQGSFFEHAQMIRELGHEVRLVRSLEDTTGLSACILPGGESTTLMGLLAETGLDEWLKKSAETGLPIYGTCAGMIILSKLGLIDIEVDRNAYGPQLHSFETTVNFQEKAFPGIFIRAPKILKAGKMVDILSKVRGTPVLVRQKNVLAGSFHPELTTDHRIHKFFLDSFYTPSPAAAGFGA
jgi:pyridoxal 5'-phosphate synthase pdxT subunit